MLLGPKIRVVRVPVLQNMNYQISSKKGLSIPARRWANLRIFWYCRWFSHFLRFCHFDGQYFFALLRVKLLCFLFYVEVWQCECSAALDITLQFAINPDQPNISLKSANNKSSNNVNVLFFSCSGCTRTFVNASDTSTFDTSFPLLRNFTLSPVNAANIFRTASPLR